MGEIYTIPVGSPAVNLFYPPSPHNYNFFCVFINDLYASITVG